MSYDIQLEEFWQKTIKKRALLHDLETLYQNQREWQQKIEDLEKIKLEQNQKVSKLEKKSFFSFFKGSSVKRKEKLEEGRFQVKLAEEQYAEALLELETVHRSIQLKEAEKKDLEGCEEKFEKMLQVKKRQIELSKGIESQKLLCLEQKISENCKDKNSILKAIAAGEWMLKEIENIRLILERAEDAAMKESAMGTFMEVEKYQQLGKAQERISVLQKRLDEFTELCKNIKIDNGQIVDLSVFYQFGNGIYSSWAQSELVMDVTVVERIRTAKGSMNLLKKEINLLMERLTEILEQSKEKERSVIMELEEFVVRQKLV